MRRRTKLLLVFGFFLLLVVIQIRNPQIVGPYKGILGNVLNPIVYAVNGISSAISGVWSEYVWLIGVAKENDALSERIELMQLENAVLAEKLVQLDNLNRLLNFKDTYAFSTIAANVIGRNTGGYMRYIIIDRGSTDGIEINAPVVSASGLVGRVSNVFFNTSEVMLLYHHDSNVSVMNSRTRAVGMLKGDGRGGLFVDFYDRLDAAQPDDVMITSGMGQLYPKGIRCGTVSEIQAPPTGLFQKLIINGSVDNYKLEQVLVVTDTADMEIEMPVVDEMVME
ncbi:MAG: rod shape-determining protein MreC [Deferribacteraceae bacterium]|jgi:rod shape-determining protein MreC|nr:rod shape-determining protein MreC [Deferribacteraceae bacterium]